MEELSSKTRNVGGNGPTPTFIAEGDQSHTTGKQCKAIRVTQRENRTLKSKCPLGWVTGVMCSEMSLGLEGSGCKL